MSRHLGSTFLLVILALLFAVAIEQDAGYVLISWRHSSMELSLVLAAALWLLSLWLMIRLVAIERWLLRLWRSDWISFWGLRSRKSPTKSSASEEK